MAVTKCCCCADLRTGVQVMAVLRGLFSVIGLIVCCYLVPKSGGLAVSFKRTLTFPTFHVAGGTSYNRVFSLEIF